MADPFLVDKRAIHGPATHAIVIGVGYYPHLPGGGRRQVASPEGMAQLSSPPVSARDFATWLIGTLNYPDKPLADVALLLSERPPKPFRNPRTGADLAVQPATMDNIETALTEWRQRGRADDRLIFYFCGHGMAKPPNLTLLGQDYGAKPLNPLDGAFDFQYFKSAMALAAAPEQLYFVDACRNTTASLVRAGQTNGRTIFTDDILAPRNPNLRTPIFYSTLPGNSAYGREKRPSAYTEALLDGLNGAGATDNGLGWRVTTLRLQEALDFHVERALKQVGRTQLPAADNQVLMDLHVPKDEPKGTALVACVPGDATREATLTFSGRGRTERRPKTRTGEWVLELLPGMYEFRAEFGGGRWKGDPVEKYVQPVFLSVPIKVSR